jgi:hypothetical protein
VWTAIVSAEGRLRKDNSGRVRDPEGERERVRGEIVCARERSEGKRGLLMHASQRDSRRPFIVREEG